MGNVTIKQATQSDISVLESILLDTVSWLNEMGQPLWGIEDMREQLAITLTSFPKAKVIDGTAKATTLADHSVDVITNSQALNIFDLDKFRAECF